MNKEEFFESSPKSFWAQIIAHNEIVDKENKSLDKKQSKSNKGEDGLSKNTIYADDLIASMTRK